MTQSVPLYRAKADLFRTLGHPVRIRVLELLLDGSLAVRDLLANIDIESSSLSQQLRVLREHGLVTSARDGATMRYTLASPEVADLLRAGRAILTAEVLAPSGADDGLDGLDDLAREEVGS